MATSRTDLELAKTFVREAVDVDPAARRSILDFCSEHPDALHRSCLAGHLTGSALVVDPSRGASLLIHHAKLDRWLQPGGHADGDGDLGRVALREATEETGLDGLSLVLPAIDLDIHEIPERGDEPAHLHLDVRFLVLAPAGAEADHNHEALDARWVTAAEASSYMDDGELKRLFRKGLAMASHLA
ncbi:MAG: NUDIX hydrolase [Acidimicrobiales bacterium]